MHIVYSLIMFANDDRGLEMIEVGHKWGVNTIPHEVSADNVRVGHNPKGPFL